MKNACTHSLARIRPQLRIALLALLISTASACSSGQDTPVTTGGASPHNPADTLVGGYCDGCELANIGMPDRIPVCDTSAGWYEPGRKLLLTGTVVQKDGRTPAPGIIVYYWHTDDSGHYAANDAMDRRALRHGHIRGWLKTDSAGAYALYTIRPRAYPDRSEPEHIHIAIKEPRFNYAYYIDELVFDDDPLLAQAIRQRPRENRGGSGILNVSLIDGLMVARHTITLGLHIPHYPE